MRRFVTFDNKRKLVIVEYVFDGGYHKGNRGVAWNHLQANPLPHVGRRPYNNSRRGHNPWQRWGATQPNNIAYAAPLARVVNPPATKNKNAKTKSKDLFLCKEL